MHVWQVAVALGKSLPSQLPSQNSIAVAVFGGLDLVAYVGRGQDRPFAMSPSTLAMALLLLEKRSHAVGGDAVY